MNNKERLQQSLDRRAPTEVYFRKREKRLHISNHNFVVLSSESP